MTEDQARGLVALTHGGDPSEIKIVSRNITEYHVKGDFDIVYEVGGQSFRCAGYVKSFRLPGRDKLKAYNAEKARNKSAVAADGVEDGEDE